MARQLLRIAAFVVGIIASVLSCSSRDVDSTSSLPDQRKLGKTILDTDLELGTQLVVVGDSAITLATAITSTAQLRQAVVLRAPLPSIPGPGVRWQGPKFQNNNSGMWVGGALGAKTWVAINRTGENNEIHLVDTLVGADIWAAMGLPGQGVRDMAQVGGRAIVALGLGGLQAIGATEGQVWKSQPNFASAAVAPSANGVVTAGFEIEDMGVLGVAWTDSSGAIDASLRVRLPSTGRVVFPIETKGSLSVLSVATDGAPFMVGVIVAVEPGKLLWAKVIKECSSHTALLDDDTAVISAYQGGADIWDLHLSLADGSVKHVQAGALDRRAVVASADFLVQTRQTLPSPAELWVTDRWNNASDADSGACRNMQYSACAADTPDKVIGCKYGKCLPAQPAPTCLPQAWTDTTP